MRRNPASLNFAQDAVPAFTPTAYLLCFGALIGCATLSWATILRYGLGLRPALSTAASAAATAATAASAAAADASAAAPTTTATCASSSVAKRKPLPPYSSSGETSPLLAAPPPHAIPLRHAAQRIAPVCLVAWPVAAVTWGLGPSLLQFATAHTGCSCDPTSLLTRHTYS